MDFGDEIGRTIRRVLNGQEFFDLKNTINRTMRNVPGMGGGPFSGGPYYDGSFPHLSKDDDYEPGSYDAYGTNTYETNTYGTQNLRTYGKKPKGTSFVPSTLLLVFGYGGAIPSGLLGLAGIGFEASRGNIPAVITVSSVFGVFFLVSLVLIFLGNSLRKRTKRFRLYQKVLNGRTFCEIRELSAASRQEPKYIVKDLRKMIASGLFPEGYLDEQETCLMTDYNTYNQYLETMKSAKERQEAEKREQEKWANREGGAALKETTPAAPAASRTTAGVRG
jgi:hypothetical protein